MQNYLNDKCGLSIAALTIVTSIALCLVFPPYFLIHKTLADTLYYFLMVKQIVSGEGHSFRLAENGPPIVYAYGSSYLYSLVSSKYDSFPDSIRKIQFMNIVILTAHVWVSLKYLRMSLPSIRPVYLVVILFFVTAIDRRWQVGVLQANSDVFPALLTMAGIMLAHKSLQDGRPQARNIIPLTLVCGLGSLVKLSTLALVLGVAIHWLVGRGIRGILLALGAIAAIIAVIGIMNFDVFIYYLNALIRLVYVSEVGYSGPIDHLYLSLTTFIFSALPSQIIPNFNYIFVDNLISLSNSFRPREYGLATAIGMTAGASLTVVTVYGLWLKRRQVRLELTLLLLVLPVFILVPNSTSRYLMAYQPVFLVGFLAALSLLSRPLLSALCGAVLVILCLAQFDSIRIRTREAKDLVTYVHEVNDAYRGATVFLNGLDPQSTRIVYFRSSFGPDHSGSKNRSYVGSEMWLAATMIPQVIPDEGFASTVASKRTLVVLSCEKRDCPWFDTGREVTLAKLDSMGAFRYSLSFQATTSSAIVEVYDVAPSAL